MEYSPLIAGFIIILASVYFSIQRVRYENGDIDLKAKRKRNETEESIIIWW